MKTDVHLQLYLAKFSLDWEMFTQSCTVNQNTHFTFNKFSPSPDNLAIYEILRKNILLPDRPQMTMWHLRIACRIPKATNTHSEYVVLISFTLGHWLG